MKESNKVEKKGYTVVYSYNLNLCMTKQTQCENEFKSADLNLSVLSHNKGFA